MKRLDYRIQEWDIDFMRYLKALEKRKSVIEMHPIRRLGTVEVVVNTMCWPASDEASFVIGSALDVDGGTSL